MSIGLVNLVMLFGLIAVIIPPLIHLLNRQRYKVVDWGAMQFLQISSTKRRRLLLEELLLMLLRMGLIAVLVVALTAPFAMGPFVAQFANRPNRDVVLIFDGSTSMTLDDGKNVTPHEAAKAWAKRFLGELSPGDTISIVMARQQPVPVMDQPSRDLAGAQEKIARLPQPQGNCNGPRAVSWALDLLRTHGQHDEQDIIILTDGQRPGWFDPASMKEWNRLQSVWQQKKEPGANSNRPRLWLVNVDAERKDEALPSYYLEPLRSTYSHFWRYQPVQFSSSLVMKGPRPFAAPYQMHLLVDGKKVRDLAISADYPWNSGEVPLNFTHRFTETGSHLVSILLEADPPPEKRGLEYGLKDFLSGDNRCDMAVMVRDRLPVLLVDGEDKLGSESSTSSLRKAFHEKAEGNHPSAVQATVVALPDFDPAFLNSNHKGPKPRVLILADVPTLNTEQQKAVEFFLEQGGGVLVVAGERVGDGTFYNQELFRAGKGWLPARLEKVAGNRKEPEKAATVEMSELQPPLGIFRDKAKATLDQARFPLWWKVSKPAGAQTSMVAMLNSGDPLLVEKPYKKGKVLLCAVPLDHTWGSNLPGIWEYPVLVHELVYYLANTKAQEFNLAPGQPIRYEPEDSLEGGMVPELPTSVVVERPDKTKETIKVDRWPLLYEKTEQPGVYQVQFSEGKPIWYVVNSDRQESDLVLATTQEKEKMQKLVPVRYNAEPNQVGLAVIGSDHREDIWWCLMLVVILLLCAEIWMTRRMVARREG